MPKIRFRASGIRCPLCRVPFAGAAQDYSCPACQVRYHQDCALELGGCATLGCPRLGVGPDEETPTEQGRRARLARHAQAARERRADRGRLRADHRREAQEAGVGTTWTVWGAAEAVIAALDCASLLGCLTMSSLLLAAGLTLALR